MTSITHKVRGYMINNDDIKKQLIKVENVDYAWITDIGNLIIHANSEIIKPIIP